MQVSKRGLMGLFMAGALGLSWVGCAGRPVVPDTKNITVAREEPKSSCRELDRVQGNVKTTTGKVDDAIEDMKLDAARKGANYVRIDSTGAMGTSVSGTAFICP